MDELYQKYRSQVSEVDITGNLSEDMYLKANSVISYVNKLGTGELYQTIGIQEGDFCLIQDGPKSWENTYSTPQCVNEKNILKELFPRRSY